MTQPRMRKLQLFGPVLSAKRVLGFLQGLSIRPFAKGALWLGSSESERGECFRPLSPRRAFALRLTHTAYQ